VVSQTDVVRYMHSCRDRLGDILDKTVQELGLVNPNKTIGCIDAHDLAIDGFRKISLKGIGGIAVVQNGHLIGNLASSDLRGITQETMADILLPVIEYLTRNGPLREPIVCSSDTKFGDVIRMVVESKIHRVWVVNDERKPIGVITLTDIVTKFSPFDWIK